MSEIWLRKFDRSSVTMCFKVKVFDNIDLKFSSPVSPMPLPEESGEENILVKMEGNSHVVNLTWLIKNEDVNAGISNSAQIEAESELAGYEGNSQTIFEQVKWFSRADGGFIGRHFEDAYDIVILNNTTGMSINNMSSSTGSGTDEFVENLDMSNVVLRMKGYIRSISMRTSSGEPATFRANIEFIEGDSIGGYQSKMPNMVRNFKVVTPPSNTDTTMTLSYTSPSRVGSSAILAYDIAHKVTSAGGEYTIQNPSPATATSITVSGLSSGTEYNFKVAGRNTQGRGEWSRIISKSTT